MPYPDWLRRKHDAERHGWTPAQLFGAPPDQAMTTELLNDCITLSGLSLRAFAEQVVGRDERTVRRWRAGASPVPHAVTRLLERYRTRQRQSHAARAAIAARTSEP